MLPALGVPGESEALQRDTHTTRDRVNVDMTMMESSS
jgi:hypothetical protein